MTEFFLSPLNTFWTAATNLALPALIFAAIALASGGGAAIRKARNAAGEVRTNAILFGFDAIFIAPALGLMIAAAGGFIQRHGLVAPIAWDAAPVWLVAALALFAGDFIAYWRHRLEHTGLFWPAHAIHHSDTAMTWTTGVRFHPFNRVTTALIDSGALALLGFPPWALLFNNLVRHYYGLFIHMDLPWTYGPLGRLFVSPAMHRWHHIREADGAGVNFATVFSVFDQAWRTFHLPGPCDVALGVRDPIGRGALAQLVWPVRALARWSRRTYDALRPKANKGTRMPQEIA